jgi:hypothetical protein
MRPNNATASIARIPIGALVIVAALAFPLSPRHAFGAEPAVEAAPTPDIKAVPEAGVRAEPKPGGKSAGGPPVRIVAEPVFKDVTNSSGLIFRHYGPSVDERLRNLGPWFTALGAGGAVGDVNNDGLLDIYMTNSLRGKPNALFINKGGMKFEEHAADYGVADVNDDHDYSMMSLLVDLDNDGWKDLVVVRSGRSLIYRNVHGERFELVKDALIDAPSPRNPVSVVAFDYDRDGLLDLYFGCYFPDVDLTQVKGGKGLLHDSWESARNGGTNFLMKNLGNFKFVDRTKESGLGDTGWTLAVGVGDLDKDGWPDLYIANDFGTDKVYRNNGDGTFTDVSLKAIGIDTKKGMNADLGDFDNDGFLDIYVTNITEPFLHECNMLWHNNGDMTFTDVASDLGVCDTKWGWGAKFFDYDNDGFLDLYVMNGFISAGKKDYIDILMPIILDSDVDLSNTMNWPALGDMSFSGYERKKLFHNVNGLSFEDVSAKAGVDVDTDGRGLITADLDNDGNEDLVLMNANQNAIVFQNLTKGGNWLQIELEGTKSNRDGIGTRATAYFADGSLIYRETNAGNGFESQSSMLVQMGLGTRKSIDELEVIWPSGTVQHFHNVAANTRFHLRENDDLVAMNLHNSAAGEAK